MNGNVSDISAIESIFANVRGMGLWDWVRASLYAAGVFLPSYFGVHANLEIALGLALTTFAANAHGLMTQAPIDRVEPPPGVQGSPRASPKPGQVKETL